MLNLLITNEIIRESNKWSKNIIKWAKIINKWAKGQI